MTDLSPAPIAEAGETFVPDDTSPRAARVWLTPLLAEWAVEAVAGDALLVVSELVTNAVVHGEGPVRLRLCRHTGGLRIEVGDDGPGRVEPRDPDPDAPGGRGLKVVAYIAVAWGVTARSPLGKTVWVELALP